MRTDGVLLPISLKLYLLYLRVFASNDNRALNLFNFHKEAIILKHSISYNFSKWLFYLLYWYKKATFRSQQQSISGKLKLTFQKNYIISLSKNLFNKLLVMPSLLWSLSWYFNALLKECHAPGAGEVGRRAPTPYAMESFGYFRLFPQNDIAIAPSPRKGSIKCHIAE